MTRERGSGVTPKPLVELLKKAIAEKGLLGIANASGVGKSAIDRYSKGIGEPTTATLTKFADYFEVSLGSLRGANTLSPQLLDAQQNNDPPIVFAKLMGVATAFVEESKKDHPDNIHVIQDACRIAADYLLLAAADIIPNLPQETQDQAIPLLKNLRESLERFTPVSTLHKSKRFRHKQ